MRGARNGAIRGLQEAARHALFLSPGLADAALSSLAGFAASLYAVRSLDGPALGAFSLYLSAYVVAALFAQHLLFLPAQIAALKGPREARPAILGPTLWRGALLSMLVAPFAAASGLILGDDVSTATLVGLGAGAAMLTVITPLQDHVRSTLHLAGHHSAAAVVSGAQLAFTLAALGVLITLDVAEAWVPFSALAFGTGVSGLVGLRLAYASIGGFELPPVRSLMATGSALLPAALVQETAIFLSGAALATLASAAALGSAEAARLVSRPVQAFSLGVSRTLAPRLMEAGESGSRAQARSSAGLYALAIGVAGLLYLAVAGWSYPVSPFVKVVPQAYVEDGLVALFLVATLAGAVSQIPRGILLGASRGKAVLAISLVAALSRVGLVVLLAGALEAYALPVAHMVSLSLGGAIAVRTAREVLDGP